MANQPQGELTFTPRELKALAESPEAIQAAIDWHDHDLTMADAVGAVEVVQHHERRVRELKEWAMQLQERRNNGW